MAQNKGGRISPDGRPAQAAGVGKDSKRHDLERPKTPTDLPYGDRKRFEEGQQVAPAQQQQPAAAQPVQAQPVQARENPDLQVPDAIDFLGGQASGPLQAPQPRRDIDFSRGLTWLPILRQLADGPGASPALVSAFIDQARRLSSAGAQPATYIDLQTIDDGIEAGLNRRDSQQQ